MLSFVFNIRGGTQNYTFDQEIWKQEKTDNSVIILLVPQISELVSWT